MEYYEIALRVAYFIYGCMATCLIVFVKDFIKHVKCMNKRKKACNFYGEYIDTENLKIKAWVVPDEAFYNVVSINLDKKVVGVKTPMGYRNISFNMVRLVTDVDYLNKKAYE